MSIQIINTGTSPNAGNGDTLRSAFIKVNNNFVYLNDSITNSVLTSTIGLVTSGIVSSGGYPLDNDGLALVWNQSTESPGLLISNSTSGITPYVHIRGFGQNKLNGTTSTTGITYFYGESARGNNENLIPPAELQGLTALVGGGYDGNTWTCNYASTITETPAILAFFASEQWKNYLGTGSNTATNVGSGFVIRLQPRNIRLGDNTTQRVLQSIFPIDANDNSPGRNNIYIGNNNDTSINPSLITGDGNTTHIGQIGSNVVFGHSNLTIQGVVNTSIATFTGEISGTTLTVTSVTNGVISIGSRIYSNVLGGSGNVQQGTFIDALGSGNGGTGTYILNNSQIVSTSTLYSGPDNQSLNSTNGFTIYGARRSALSGRRNSLKVNDTVGWWRVQGQTTDNGVGQTGRREVGNFFFRALENFTLTSAGTAFYVNTVNSGTTALSRRLLLSNLDNSYLSNEHTFHNADFTGTFLSISNTASVFSNDLLPNVDLAYDLGSVDRQWRSLYVGTSTIYLGGTALSVSGGNLTIDGSPVSGGSGSGSALVNGTYTAVLSTTGNIVLPGSGSINGSDYDVTIAAGDDGSSTYGHVTLKTNGPNGVNEFYMNSLGELNLPRGGVIQETEVINELWGTTTTSLTLVPAGAANGTQRLEIYSTGGGEGNHIHITSGDQNQTDLFLGNDTQYFAVGAMGQMEIRARPGLDSPTTGTSAYAGSPVWIYAGDAGDNGGNTIDGAAGGDVIISAGTASAGSGGSIELYSANGPTGFGSIKLSTNGGGTFWTFGTAGNLTFPDGTTQTTAYAGSGGGGIVSPYADIFTITNTTNSIGTTTGALQVAGGAGIGGDLYVGGSIQTPLNITAFGVGYFGPTSTIPLGDPLAVFTNDVDSYTQVQIQNKSNGAFASSDYIATADNGDDTSNYVDLGINSSGYDNPSWTVSGPGDAYLYTSDGSLTVGVLSPGKLICMHVGGSLDTDVVAIFREPNTAASDALSGSFVVKGGIGLTGDLYANGKVIAGSTLTFTPANANFQYGGNKDGFLQLAIQNANASSTSTTDLVAFTDNGNDLGGFIDIGITSSGYNDPLYGLSSGGDGFLYVVGTGTNTGKLIISTYQPQDIIFSTGGGNTGHEVGRWKHGQGLVVATNTESTSTTTGALVVTGGIGLGGTLNIGQSIKFSDGTTQTTAYRFVNPPVNSTSTGVAGSLAQDASYFYVCTATNAWQRIAWDNTPW